jgi:hypothetical protein
MPLHRSRENTAGQDRYLKIRTRCWSTLALRGRLGTLALKRRLGTVALIIRLGTMALNSRLGTMALNRMHIQLTRLQGMSWLSHSAKSKEKAQQGNVSKEKMMDEMAHSQVRVSTAPITTLAQSFVAQASLETGRTVE